MISTFFCLPYTHKMIRTQKSRFSTVGSTAAFYFFLKCLFHGHNQINKWCKFDPYKVCLHVFKLKS